MGTLGEASLQQEPHSLKPNCVRLGRPGGRKAETNVSSVKTGAKTEGFRLIVTPIIIVILLLLLIIITTIIAIVIATSKS